MTTDLLPLLLAQFKLEGEDVVRRSNGKVQRPTPDARGYKCVKVATGVRHGRQVNYHKLKFALAHGWLPPMVDHQDRDPHNDNLGNLRPATPQQNQRNRRFQMGRTLPRGVYHVRRLTKNPYRAQAGNGAGIVKHLGMHPTPEVASQAVEAYLRELHADFYCPPERSPKA